jgi:uncharacterized protein
MLNSIESLLSRSRTTAPPAPSAVLLGLVVVNLVIAVDALTGLGKFAWNGKPALWIEYAGLIFDGLTFSALAALGEEYGWRGYLLPKLLPLGEVKAAVIVGAIFVLRGSFNAFGDKLTDTNHLTSSPLVVTPGGAVGFGVILLTAVIAYSLSKTGRLRHRPLTARVAASNHPAG